jgi:hypothetical protein
MPTSSAYQLERILGLIVAANPQSVLDVGTGFGKYGMLVREYLEIWAGGAPYGAWKRRLEGIEGFAGYVSPVHDYLYDEMHVGNALEILPALESRFDLALVIDVIEHFTREDGERLIRECERVARNVILATPRRFFDQGAVFENALETHRSHWSARELAGESGFVLKSVDSLIVFRGPDAALVRGRYRRRRMKDGIKNRFPFTMRLAGAFGWHPS